MRVRYVHPVSRQRVRITCASAHEGAAVLESVRSYRVALRAGQMTPEEVTRRLARRCNESLRTIAAEWARTRAPNTRANAVSLLKTGPLSTLAGEPLEALTADRLSRWVSEQTRSYRDSSILQAWTVLSAVVRAAIQARRLDFVPWGDWRPPRRLDPTPRPREVVTDPTSARRLLDAARELDDECRGPLASLEARVTLALLVGLRAGELSGLRWSDVDEARGRITIARQLDGARTKTHAAAVAAPPYVFEALARLRARLEGARLYASEGPVFPSWLESKPGRPKHRRRRALEPGDVRRIVVRACLPNPDKWTVHSLRASFMCLELASSGSLGHAMARGRHRSLKSVQAYARGLIELAPPAPSWELPPAPPPVPRLES